MTLFADPMVALAALAGVLAAAVAGLALLLARTRRALAEARTSARSRAARYGRLTEQFAPFMADYPHDPAGFRFLGTPVDGVQFSDDGVYLVEFKAGRSGLSAAQRRVRDHVRAGRVGWLELRLREGRSDG